MLQETSLLGFFLIGLSGGFGHCIGMCAPFVLFISGRFGPEDGESPLGRLWPQFLYGLGRSTTYAAMGAAAGALGGAVQAAGELVGVQKAASVLAGALLLLFGVASLFDLSKLLAPEGGPLARRVSAFFVRRRPDHPYVAGLLLGLLPCGLLYGVLIGAAATGAPLQGGASMAVFGLGTLPAMMGLSLVADLVRRRRNLLNKLAALLMAGWGLWFVYDGLTM